MCLMCRTTEKDPRQGSRLSAGMGRATEEDWSKRPSDHQLQEARKKDSDRAVTPAAEGVHVPANLALPGSLQAKQLCHLHAQLSLGQSCDRQKNVLYLCTQGHFSSVQLCRLWSVRLLCQGGEFSRQEYWSVLANTGCHALLEHYISCCSSCQLL